MASLLTCQGRFGPDGVYVDRAAYFPKLLYAFADPSLRAIQMFLISLCPLCYLCAYPKAFVEFWAHSRSLMQLNFFDKSGLGSPVWLSVFRQISLTSQIAVGIACVSLLLCGWYSVLRRIAQGYHLPERLTNPRHPPSWMKGKIAVITGGSAGIGLETTKQLALWGVHVFIGCRHVDEASRFAHQFSAITSQRNNAGAVASPGCVEKKAARTRSPSAPEEAHSVAGSIRVYYLDLFDMESVQVFAKWALAESGGKIDFLINNAGIVSTEQLTVDARTGFEKHFVLNHLGPFLLTQMLLPAVKKANGRIVNLSSIVHVVHTRNVRPLDYAVSLETATAIASKLKKPLSLLQGEPITRQNYDSRRAYAETKLFNLWFTKALQRRLAAEQGCKATTYAVHPGIVNTTLLRHYSEGTTGWLAHLRGAIHRIFAPLVLKTPAQGAATQLMLCVTDRQQLNAGAYYADGTNSWVDPIALDQQRQEELWEISMLACQPYLNGRTPSPAPEGQKAKVKGEDA